MKVLITGATGYIGFHLVEHFLRRRDNVHILIRPTSDVSRLEKTGTSLGIHRLNVEGPEAVKPLRDIVEAIQPDCVFHLASAGDGKTDSAFIDLVRTNIVFTTALLDAVSAVGSSGFINVGSYWQFNELGDVAPNGLYAASKQAAHDLMSHYVLNKELKAASVILYDVYGPIDWRKKLTHVLFDSLENQTQMTSGEQLLNMVFIEDAVNALSHCATWLTDSFELKNGVPRFFAGSEELHSLRSIAEMFARISDAPAMIEWGALPYRSGQIFRPCAPDPIVPGWKAKISLETGLTRVVQAGRN